MKKLMTLTHFLNYFDFDYKLYLNDDGSMDIGLIDNQGVNLGDIESDRFEISALGINRLVDRLDIYIDDYVFNEMEGELEDRGVTLPVRELSYWNELYDKYKKVKCVDDYAECVLNPELIELDSIEKKIN